MIRYWTSRIVSTWSWWLGEAFRTQLKDQLRHYAVYLPDEEPLNSFGVKKFTTLHDQHWMIEPYHRAIKQLCHIEHVQVAARWLSKITCLPRFVAMYNYNDDAAVLCELSERLFQHSVIPYYLHLLDKATGTGYFAVSET
jgi:hypothetical protein